MYMGVISFLFMQIIADFVPYMHSYYVAFIQQIIIFHASQTDANIGASNLL